MMMMMMIFIFFSISQQLYQPGRFSDKHSKCEYDSTQFSFLENLWHQCHCPIAQSQCGVCLDIYSLVIALAFVIEAQVFRAIDFVFHILNSSRSFPNVVINWLYLFQGETTLSPFLKERDDRVQTMTHWCSKLKPRAPDPSTITEDKLGQMLVDDKHKFLYCQIPGVAQTDWRRILVFLTGQVKVASHLKISGSDVHSKYGKYLKKLSDFPPAERKKRIQNYFKVMFVREPMERLVSSYKSKFEAKYSKYFHQSFGRKIVKKYRKKPTKESLQKGSDVTFSEFIQFVIDSEHSEENLNEHWQQYYKQCHPCLVSYDFIGKYETLNDDVNHVLEKINAAQKIKGPLGTSNFTYQEKLLKTMYKSVSPKNLQRLWKIYYPDYNLFSYPYPSVLDNLLDFQGIPWDRSQKCL